MTYKVVEVRILQDKDEQALARRSTELLGKGGWYIHGDHKVINWIENNKIVFRHYMTLVRVEGGK